ncbi:hypothetical protein BSKO_00233 [Bryopsis sp. KO-2023]|nr:hypothetical protein BSKO_00233 [Bryopsis sp. KO-2023]
MRSPAEIKAPQRWQASRMQRTAAAKQTPHREPEVGKQPQAERKRVACIGDSITRGDVGFNWVRDLSTRLEDCDFTAYATNGNCAFNALQRVPEVVASKPTHVFVLIGTNDVNSQLSELSALFYTTVFRLPCRPTARVYRSQLREIIRKLKTETDADVTVLTLPPFGEDFKSTAAAKIRESNQIIAEVAEEEGVKVLPLFDEIIAACKVDMEKAGLPFYTGAKLLFMGIISGCLYYVWGWDWDRIAQYNGFTCTVDSCHLSSTSGKAVASLVERHLRGGED